MTNNATTDNTNNNNFDECTENDANYDYNFENAEDGDGGGGNNSFLPSSASSYQSSNLPKRRKGNNSGSGFTVTANQRWVKVHRRPMAPTDEVYFGSSPFASFTVPTWVKVQDLTEKERAVYDKLQAEKQKNTITQTSGDGEERDGNSSSEDVVVVVPSAQVTDSGEAAIATAAAAHTHKEMGEEEGDKQQTPAGSDVDHPSAAMSTTASADPSSAMSNVIDGTTTPLIMTTPLGTMTMNNVEEEAGEAKEEDAVVVVVADMTMESSPSSMMGDLKNSDTPMELVDDNNHDGGNTSGGIDRLDQDEAEDDQGGEGEEDNELEEGEDEQDEDDNEEGDLEGN